jgi:disulfide bond formation protein DsbB
MATDRRPAPLTIVALAISLLASVLLYDKIVTIIETQCRLCLYEVLALAPIAAVLLVSVARGDSLAVRRWAMPLGVAGLLATLLRAVYARGWVSNDRLCGINPSCANGVGSGRFLSLGWFDWLTAVTYLVTIAAAFVPRPAAPAAPPA